jgi:hypothetical protein
MLHVLNDGGEVPVRVVVNISEDIFISRVCLE